MPVPNGFLFGWISRLWTLCVLLFTFSFRVGEAAVPGPSEASSGDGSAVQWDVPGTPDFVLGLFNPSGISNKYHVVDQLPSGWWHVAETQASKPQQCSFQAHLKGQAYRQGGCVHSTFGAPAAFRAGSSHAGTWTGVLSYGPCLLRSVALPWPSGVFESGRVLMTAANIFGLEIVAATVYLPPRGPTYPNALELADTLLSPISAELVLGRLGCRAIFGDMNRSMGALPQMRLWQANGWIEIQTLMNRLHGIPCRPTCKGATSPDQVWLSPELAALVTNSALLDVFPDHHAVLAGIKLPRARWSELQWPLPGHVPWDKVDLDRWNDSLDLGPISGTNPSHVVGGGLSTVHEGEHAGSNFSSTRAFKKWSKGFEVAVSQCLSASVGQSDRSFHGRGSLVRPKLRSVNAPVIKPHRPGELAPASGFLNRSVAAWFKQMRRIQSYLHASRSARAADTYPARAALWNSIRLAPGFSGGFCAWWGTRPFQLQGSPAEIPLLPPDVEFAELLYSDFLVNYRQYEHWQLRRRTESCQAKLLADTKGLSAATRKPPKPPLEYLVDSLSHPIEVVDTLNNLVRVPSPCPSSASACWLLQGQPAGVAVRGDLYQVDSDFVLASGQILTCQVWVTEVDAIHERLRDLWSPRWNKHKDVPEDVWEQACQVASRTLPRGSIDLPPISVQDFRKAAAAFKSQAATGPCGWTRADINHLTDMQIQHVLDGYHEYEHSGQWPQQWCVGLIHCLQKRDVAHEVEGFRPITVTSIFYRLFAGIRSGQILGQLARFSDELQCGFMKGRQASDVWYFIGVALELASHQSVPLHGVVADLVKAYNTLPRGPVFWCLELLGVPRWFLAALGAHLSLFERYFVVRRCTGSALKSVTGFPEGCPLACAAMTALDFFWHWYVRLEVPRVLPLSYVDNLELVCDHLDDLLAASQAQSRFCALLDLELDLPRLYAWSSTPGGRRDLKHRGFQVSLGERDLGGQVIYCRQLRNKVLTDRIDSVRPDFLRLRGAAIPQATKIMNIQQVLWPRALHGVEAVTLGRAHLTKLRSGVMKALKWDRAGASPAVRLSLLHHTLDPSWYQLWHVLHTFQRQCQDNMTLRSWWKDYVGGLSAQVTHGPFGKLQALINELGLQLDEDGKLWFSENGYISVFHATESLLRQVLLFHFTAFAAREVSTRAGYEDLAGCDVGLTLSADKGHPPGEVEQLHVVRDGAFFTDGHTSKFDARKNGQCGWCHQPDTKEHRYTTCSRYDEIRGRHQELFQQWDSLPVSFRLAGLVPANPWTLLVWEALVSLQDQVMRFAFEPTGHVWHVFTDGTCDSPSVPEEALAAWAVVVADHGPVSYGPLKGIQQNVLRAEITAALSALCWIGPRHGDLHLWIDSQEVVDNLRILLSGSGNPESFAHADLWCEVDRQLRGLFASVYVHKVASHVHPEDGLNPTEDFAIRWNAVADLQAKLAQDSRPSYFVGLWRRYCEFRRVWRHRVRLVTAFHLEIAAVDCHSVSSVDADEEIEQISPLSDCVDSSPNLASLHAQFLPFGSEQLLFDIQPDHHFVRVCSVLRQWIVDQDQGAATMRPVSFFEMYFVVRRLLQQNFHRLTGVVSFTEPTVAADFRLFKRMLIPFLDAAGVGGRHLSGHLRVVGVYAPQLSIVMGISFGESELVLGEVGSFVGQRPITSAQGMSRPWRV
eukprot:Skav206112  [mRNA]  locus=scaffold3597:189852:194876:+ [translate_table: standard]